MAEDFLWEKQAELAEIGKSAVFDAIEKEFSIYDLVFNLFEEEFVAGNYLDLANKKLWDYWDSYIRYNFSIKIVRNHWLLRHECGVVFPGFVEFVKQEYLSEPLDVLRDQKPIS